MTYADVVADVLRLFDGQGELVLECRSYDGIGQATHVLRPGGPATGPFMQGLVADGWTVSVRPGRDAGGRFCELPIVVAVWRPLVEFSAAQRRYVVARDGQHRIAAALARLPAPSVLVDAGPQVWAGWRLDVPIRQQAEAEAALEALATRVEADVEAVEDLRTCSLPLAGPIRNWNSFNRESIAVHVVNAARRFSIAELVVDGVSVTGTPATATDV